MNLPLKYVDVPLGARYKDSVMWDSVIELSERRLVSWKHNLLSKRGRLTLVKNTLSNIPIYYLSAFTILVKDAKKLESMCRFLWGDDDDRKKYLLLNWKEVKKLMGHRDLSIDLWWR